MNKNKLRTKADEDDEDFASMDAFQVRGKPIAMAYEVNVDENFIHPRQFANIVHLLEQAGENDHVIINLATGGGALHAILPIMGAMKNTDAHVHVHAASDVASAGTFLLMLADSVSLNDYVTFMFHNVSYGVASDGHSIEMQVTHTSKSSKKLLREIYEDFFTPKEIDSMLTGTPIYLDRDQFIEKYERRMDIRQGIIDEEEAPKIVAKKPRKKKTEKSEIVVANEI